MADTALTAERLRQSRRQNRETLSDIADLLGVNKSTVMRWEHGEVEKINRAVIEKLAAHYRVDAAWLCGEPSRAGAPKPDGEAVVPIPIVGRVSAGNGCLAHEETEGYEMIPSKLISYGEQYILLRVRGDSMYPLLLENDLVLVRHQESLENGALGVVTVDGDSGMVKRLRIEPGLIELQSENPFYPPVRFTGEDLRRVQIIGAVRRIIRDV